MKLMLSATDQNWASTLMKKDVSRAASVMPTATPRRETKLETARDIQAMATLSKKRLAAAIQSSGTATGSQSGLSQRPNEPEAQ